MGVNRALRRAAAKKAFKQDVKMSDLDKTFCNIAKEEATNKLITDLTFTMMRATCLVLMNRFKDVQKKETRVENMVNLAHEYIVKIKNKELSSDDIDVIAEVEAAMKQRAEEKE
ncbi:hypothetical protein [Phascolarctobacterium succinatutens]|uniref:hypothetical protein n=1 Tax=Phascolarctobacterium succinatutens TaxID=626940 RepID=UPI00206C1260|nr:MAG TPA: hypothetical protein [Caudoviricetes sp.]